MQVSRNEMAELIRQEVALRNRLASLVSCSEAIKYQLNQEGPDGDEAFTYALSMALLHVDEKRESLRDLCFYSSES